MNRPLYWPNLELLIDSCFGVNSSLFGCIMDQGGQRLKAAQHGVPIEFCAVVNAQPGSGRDVDMSLI